MYKDVTAKWMDQQSPESRERGMRQPRSHFAGSGLDKPLRWPLAVPWTCFLWWRLSSSARQSLESLIC